MGTTTLVGVAALPAAAGANSANLIQNGSFETVTQPVSGFLVVNAGDATTIPGWTVATPSAYPGGGGSVDVVDNTYWNAQDGNNSIDLAGTTGVPGGLYQDVTTATGAQYQLTFWSAVNGDETPGNTHTVAITVNGQQVGSVQAAGVGRPLAWVQNTITFQATSGTSRVEFDDVTAGDQNQGPALDNVALVQLSDTINASPATIAPQTTNVGFTVPVATFTDSQAGAPVGNFSATINWGDNTSSSGTVSVSNGTYTVNGTHTYAASGSYTVGVSIASIAGGSANVSDSVTVADAVTTCSGSGCSGTITTPTQTVQISSSSTTGTILTTVSGGSTAPNCGDPFRHAPQVVTINDTGLSANLLYTITFANKSAAGGWATPFAVCYQASPGVLFKDWLGKSVNTGILPLCSLIPSRVVAPCVQSIVWLPLPGYPGNVVEKVVVPPGDPKLH